MRPMNFDYLAQVVQQESGIIGACSNSFLDDSISPLGILIISTRNKFKLTREEFAEKCNIDVEEVLKIENDENFNPDIRTVSFIARYLDMKPTTLSEVIGYKKTRDKDFGEKIYKFAANCTNIKNRNGDTSNIYEQFIAILEEKGKK